MTQEVRNAPGTENVDGGMAVAEEDIRGLGSFVLVLLLFVASAGLLAFTPFLTKAPPPSMGYHTHPAFFPGIALGLTTIGSGLVAVRCLLRSWPFEPAPLRKWHFSAAAPALFGILFLGYVTLVPLFGYTLSTVMFVGVTLGLARLTLRQWLTGVLLLPVICWITFVWLFDIWFPVPSLL